MAKNFNPWLARSTEPINAHRIFSLVDLLEQTAFQENTLFAVQETLENAILDPDTKARQDAMNTGTPAVIWHVIADDVER